MLVLIPVVNFLFSQVRAIFDYFLTDPKRLLGQYPKKIVYKMDIKAILSMQRNIFKYLWYERNV